MSKVNQSPIYRLPSINNLPTPNLSEYKLPPITNLSIPNKYKCYECNSTFDRKNSLLRHQRKHSGIKPYECEVCYKRFNRKDILNRHKDSLKCKKLKLNSVSNSLLFNNKELEYSFSSAVSIPPIEEPKSFQNNY